MKHFHRHPSHRPPWWPEDEPWPPQRGQFRRNPFFRRMSCLFGLFNLLGLVAFIYLAGWIADSLNWIQSPLYAFAYAIPLGAGLFLVAILVIAGAVFTLRRLSRPLDDLLNASNRVAEGDYSVRVEESGPREIRSMAQAFNSMAERLQVTDRQRRDMLADVTHELRTPLTVIRGEVEGMIDGVYPADEKRLKSILEETQLLSRLVDDLRTLALAEAGALQLKLEPANLSALVREVVTAFQSAAEAKEVTIQVEAGESAPVEVDAGRVREVLNNLFSNALRYTPGGGIIRITSSAKSISITDSGPGIASEDLPHVFDRFYKSSDSGGMGLGLSIAKYLVEAHGGRIHAENALEGGTRITFSLNGAQ